MVAASRKCRTEGSLAVSTPSARTPGATEGAGRTLGYDRGGGGEVWESMWRGSWRGYMGFGGCAGGSALDFWGASWRIEEMGNLEVEEAGTSYSREGGRSREEG